MAYVELVDRPAPVEAGEEEGKKKEAAKGSKKEAKAAA